MDIFLLVFPTMFLPTLCLQVGKRSTIHNQKEGSLSNTWQQHKGKAVLMSYTMRMISQQGQQGQQNEMKQGM